MNSATGTALAPAVMATGMPRARAAARSILSTPMPHFWMSRSPGAASIRLAGMGVMPPTKKVASRARVSRSAGSGDVARRSSSDGGHSAVMTARTSGAWTSRKTTTGRGMASRPGAGPRWRAPGTRRGRWESRRWPAAPRSERGANGVADLIRLLDVVAPRAEELRVPVVAGVPDVRADVAPVIEVPLVGLLRAPAVVVQHQGHGGNAVPDRRLELLRVHEEPAVAVDRQRRRLGAAELGAERRRIGEPEAAQIERGEEGPRLIEVEPVVAVGGGGAGVERDDRVRRERAPELRVDPLRLDRHGVEGGLGEEARLAPGAERLGLSLPGLGDRRDPRLSERGEERGQGLARVRLDPDGDRIDAADVPRVDVDLDDRRSRLDVAPVVEARELPEPGAHHQQEVGAPARLRRLRRARPAERAHVEPIVIRHRVVAPVGRDRREPVTRGEARQPDRSRRPTSRRRPRRGAGAPPAPGGAPPRGPPRGGAARDGSPGRPRGRRRRSRRPGRSARPAGCRRTRGPCARSWPCETRGGACRGSGSAGSPGRTASSRDGRG